MGTDQLMKIRKRQQLNTRPVVKKEGGIQKSGMKMALLNTKPLGMKHLRDQIMHPESMSSS